MTISPASAGNINKMNIGATTAGTGAFTTLTASGNVTLSPTGGSVTISPSYANVTISPNGGSVTISPSMGAVTISPGGGYALTLNPTGTLTLGAAGSSQTVLAPGNNLVEQRNGTFAQTFRVYKTTDTSTTNYVRGIFGFIGASGVFTIGTDAGGSGSAARLQFGVAMTTGGGLTILPVVMNQDL